MKAWRDNETRNKLYEVMNRKNFIVFDTETTGLSTKKADIIQISAIKFEINENKDFVKMDSLNTYINPGYSIPPNITNLTGITDDMVANAPDSNEAFTELIFPFFGETPITAAYNSGFDIKFMKKLYEANGKVFEPEIDLDILKMARDILVDEKTPDKKLGTIANLYGLDTDITFHNSMDDTIVASRVMKVFYYEYKKRDEKIAAEKAAIGGSHNELIKPKITYVSFWQGYKGMSRIYIGTNCGQFYYDIRNKKWCLDKTNLFTVNEIDMDTLKANTLSFAGVANEMELSKIR